MVASFSWLAGAIRRSTRGCRGLAGLEGAGRDDTRNRDAHQLAIREQLSWLDALIAAAAIRSRCTIFFSEDFGHGRRISGVEVVNPLLG